MYNRVLIERQKWFVNLRLGMFIHFNSGTYQFNKGSIVDWEYAHENKGANRMFPFDPKDWNPSGLDCRQWAKAARSLKATFGCITAKHHEGFCLWPTKTTEHCVRNGYVKTDIIKEYVEAFRAEGLFPAIYFSMLDLTRQINRTKCSRDDVEFTKRQLTEILTNYGEIPFIIIDGWQANWGGPSYENMPFQEIKHHILSIQPDCLLINISCETNLDHTDIVMYENAAGQEIDDGFVGPGAGCNVLTNKNWFWRADDPKMELKSAQWAIDKITEFNRHNATFLLNASPNVLGRIDDNLLSRFEEIGKLNKVPEELKELPKGWMVQN